MERNELYNSNQRLLTDKEYNRMVSKWDKKHRKQMKMLIKDTLDNGRYNKPRYNFILKEYKDVIDRLQNRMKEIVSIKKQISSYYVEQRELRQKYYDLKSRKKDTSPIKDKEKKLNQKIINLPVPEKLSKEYCELELKLINIYAYALNIDVDFDANQELLYNSIVYY